MSAVEADIPNLPADYRCYKARYRSKMCAFDSLQMDAPVVQEIRDLVAAKVPAAKISDLHVWRVGGGSYACILALVSAKPLQADDLRTHLSIHEELVHVTVEIAQA
jgi:Co/Zn/Cd efflux system component